MISVRSRVAAPRKSVRVVDGEALEMPCAAMYRGFESHLFLQPRLVRGFLLNIYFLQDMMIYRTGGTTMGYKIGGPFNQEVFDALMDALQQMAVKLEELEQRISLLEVKKEKDE